jgi:Pyridoxamine 5'-phosphate oxidase
VSEPSRAVMSVLSAGPFCHVAARTRRGPHLTPMVFAVSGGSVWVTTSRGSVKARAWRDDPVVAGLVADGGEAVSFSGRALEYDALDPATWGRCLSNAPALTAATVRFWQKNARFFAGYAVDARHVPLAWTPPGRVFVEIRLERASLIRRSDVVERWGDEGPVDAPRSRSSFRAIRTVDAFEALPSRVARELGGDGVGALALEAEGGPRVLPVRWRADEGAIHASLPAAALALAGAPDRSPAALGIDRPSWWRARRMLGCMIQGSADAFVPAAVTTGRRSLGAAIERTGGAPDSDALVRLRPERIVWWQGWTSGSSRVA